MPTVIDSLIVKLGLDPAGFTKGQKEAAVAVVKQKGESEKWRKSAEVDAKKVTDAFVRFKKELIALTLAYFGLSAAKRFSSDLLSTGTSLVFLSKNTGVAIEKLSLLQEVAKRAGASSEDVSSAFLNLAKITAEWQTGKLSPEIFEPMVRAGLNVGKFFDATTTPIEKWRMLAEVMPKLTAPIAQQWGQMMGFTMGTVNMWRLGNKELDRMEQHQRGVFFYTEKDAEAARRMNIEWLDFVGRIQEAGKEILLAIEPSLLRIGRDFEIWLVKSGGVKQIVTWVKDLATWLDSIKKEDVTRFVTSLETLATVLGTILKTLGGITTAMGALIGARIGAAFGPWGALIGLIAGGIAPHLPDLLEGARDKFKETETYKKLSAQPGFEGSPLAWLAGAPEAAKANPPVMPSAATIKPLPGIGAGQGTTSVNINNVNVYTHATDAAGMAKGAKTALTRELSTVTQAGGGGQ